MARWQSRKVNITRACVDCGATFVPTGPTSKRCATCYPVWKLAARNEWNRRYRTSDVGRSKYRERYYATHPGRRRKPYTPEERKAAKNAACRKWRANNAAKRKAMREAYQDSGRKRLMSFKGRYGSMELAEALVLAWDVKRRIRELEAAS